MTFLLILAAFIAGVAVGYFARHVVALMKMGD